MDESSDNTEFSKTREKPRWGTLAMVIALHVLALFGLARAFAPQMTAQVVESVTAVFSVTVSAPEDEPSPEPDAGAAAEEGRKATPRETSAPEAKVPVRPVDIPEVSSTGLASDSGARDTGEGTGAGGNGVGTGSGAGGRGSGGGIAEGPSVRSGELNEARDFPVPEGGRKTRFGKSVTVFFTVTVEGRARNCSVARSSVDAATTALVCPLVIEKIRFNPARTADGTAVEARYGYKVDFLEAD